MADWLEITYRPTADLRPYARNPRTHSEGQIAQLAASIQAFGWTNPVLVDEGGGLIAGHGRVQAALALGIDQVPTVTLAGLSAAQKRALVIADNKLALNAGWDTAMLAQELQALDTGEMPLGLTGFGEDELERLLAWAPGFANGLTDPDEVPAAPEVPVSKAGDIWLMGRHRVLCGDATSAECVTAVLAGVAPNLMVTDPPYGVDYDPDWRNRADRANGKPYGARAVGKVDNDDRADWREAWALFSGDVAYVWHAGNKAHIVANSLLASGFDIRAQIIWAKNQFVIGRGHYHGQHEPCWYAVRNRQGATGHWSGDRTQSTLWQIDKPHKSETGHSTQKPVECMRRPIENNSSPGQAVYDPFVGSGTTIIAAEMTGRACFAIELNPAYVDVAVERWQNFTGKKATLESSGALFLKVEHESKGPRSEAAAVASEAH